MKLNGVGITLLLVGLGYLVHGLYLNYTGDIQKGTLMNTCGWVLWIAARTQGIGSRAKGGQDE